MKSGLMNVADGDQIRGQDNDGYLHSYVSGFMRSDNTMGLASDDASAQEQNSNSCQQFEKKKYRL
jgi:hypothetical protein